MKDTYISAKELIEVIEDFYKNFFTHDVTYDYIMLYLQNKLKEENNKKITAFPTIEMKLLYNYKRNAKTLKELFAGTSITNSKHADHIIKKIPKEIYKNVSIGQDFNSRKVRHDTEKQIMVHFLIKKIQHDIKNFMPNVITFIDKNAENLSMNHCKIIHNAFRKTLGVGYIHQIAHKNTRINLLNKMILKFQNSKEKQRLFKELLQDRPLQKPFKLNENTKNELLKYNIIERTPIRSFPQAKRIGNDLMHLFENGLFTDLHKPILNRLIMYTHVPHVIRPIQIGNYKHIIQNGKLDPFFEKIATMVISTNTHKLESSIKRMISFYKALRKNKPECIPEGSVLEGLAVLEQLS